MDAMTPLGLTLAKIFALLLVASSLACSASLDDKSDGSDSDGEDAKATSPGVSDGPSKLEAHLDAGDYVATITSTALDCRDALGGQALVANFAAPAGTPDAGLIVDLTVVGKLAAGASVDRDNARADHGFEVDVTTPRGVAYRYQTPAGDLASAHAAATLTKVSGGAYSEDYTLSLQGLAATAATPNATPLTLSALLHCVRSH